MDRLPFLALAALLVVAVAGVGLALADASPGERHGTMRWVVVGDDGTRHERTIEIDGQRARLGVALAPAADGGARVESVVEGSAAERAGLREGDIVVAFDGEPVESPWDLTGAVLSSSPGDRVSLEVLRDGRSTTVDAELDEADDWGHPFAFHGDWGFDAEGLQEQLQHLGEMEFEFDMSELHEQLEELGERLEELDIDLDVDLDGLHDLHGLQGLHGLHALGTPGANAFVFRSSRPRLGVELVSATDELRRHLGADGDRGVLVGRVRDDMPAGEAGIEVGDLIVAVDGEPVGDAGDLRRLLAERDGSTFGIDVVRDRIPLTLTVTLPSPDGDI